MRIFGRETTYIVKLLNENNRGIVFGTLDKARLFVKITSDNTKTLRSWVKRNKDYFSDDMELLDNVRYIAIGFFDFPVDDTKMQSYKDNLAKVMPIDSVTEFEGIMQAFYDNNLRVEDSLSNPVHKVKFNGIRQLISSSLFCDIKDEIDNFNKEKEKLSWRRHLSRSPSPTEENRSSPIDQILRRLPSSEKVGEII